MSGRLRQRYISYGTGGHATPLAVGIGPVDGPAAYRNDTSSDIVGNYPNPNPMTIEHRHNWRWRASGTCQYWWEMDNFVVSQGPVGHNVPGYVPSDNTSLAAGLARTNPNKATVDVPVFLAEFADIPKLMRDAFRILLKEPIRVGLKGVDLRHTSKAAGKTYLEWNFGLGPFISDLGKMLDVMGQVDRKVARLQSAASWGAPTSSATTWQDVVKTGPWTDYATNLYQEHRRVRSYYTTYWKKWVSTCWKTAVPLPRDDASLRSLAFRLTYGLDISPSTMWEAMPWTWMIDWFSNVGDVLKSRRNSVPVTHGGSCVMTKAESRIEVISFDLPLPLDSLSLVQPPYLVQSLSRNVLGDAAPTVEFNLPLLSGGQLSILSALAVVYGRH